MHHLQADMACNRVIWNTPAKENTQTYGPACTPVLDQSITFRLADSK